MPQEKIPVKIFDSSIEASKEVAQRVAGIIRKKASEGKNAVLGLATGRTPVNVYEELIRMHHEDGLSFANVITFNLDEYWPISPDAIQSYRHWMNEKLFEHIDIPRENI